MEVLVKHTYPGNVREVENLVKRMIVLGDPSFASAALNARKIDAAALGARKAASLTPSLKDVARQAARSAEREAIAKVLEDTRWNRVKAAKLLRISYRALLYKIKDVGLDGRAPSISPGLRTPAGRLRPVCFAVRRLDRLTVRLDQLLDLFEELR